MTNEIITKHFDLKKFACKPESGQTPNARLNLQIYPRTSNDFSHLDIHLALFNIAGTDDIKTFSGTQGFQATDGETFEFNLATPTHPEAGSGFIKAILTAQMLD